MFRTFDLIEHARIDGSDYNSLVQYSSGIKLLPTNVVTPLEFSVKSIDTYTISLITFHGNSFTPQDFIKHGYVTVSELCETKISSNSMISSIGILANIYEQAVNQWKSSKPSNTGFYIHYTIKGNI